MGLKQPRSKRRFSLAAALAVAFLVSVLVAGLHGDKVSRNKINLSLRLINTAGAKFIYATSISHQWDLLPSAKSEMEPIDPQPSDPDLFVLPSDLVVGIADRQVSFLMMPTDFTSTTSTFAPTAAASNTTSGHHQQLQSSLRSLPPSGSEGVVHMHCTDGFNHIFGSVEMFCNASILNRLRPSLDEVPPHWVQASVTPLLPLAGELLNVTVAVVLTVMLHVCSPMAVLAARGTTRGRVPFGGSDVFLLSFEGSL